MAGAEGHVPQDPVSELADFAAAVSGLPVDLGERTAVLDAGILGKADALYGDWKTRRRARIVAAGHAVAGLAEGLPGAEVWDPTVEAGTVFTFLDPNGPAVATRGGYGLPGLTEEKATEVPHTQTNPVEGDK